MATTRTTFPRATADQFTPTPYATAQDKATTVNAVVRFLAGGMNPNRGFSRRVYHFFIHTLSMSAVYNADGFAYQHFQDDDSKARFLTEVAYRIDRWANLDPERNSDMAVLFADPLIYGEENTPYSSLLDPHFHRL